MIIILLALAIRLLYLLDSSASPAFLTPVLDGQNYDLTARQLSEKHVLSPDLFWQPMFYPLYLAGVYALAGGSILAAKLLQVVLGAATCGLTYRLARRIGGRRLAWAAAGIVTLYGPLIFYETELLANSWAAFWAVSLLLLFLHVAEGGSLAWAVLLGICAGLSILTRPTFGPLVAVGGIWLALRLIRSVTARQAASTVAAAAAAGALVLLPAALLTGAVTGRYAIRPASAGLNLYLGNNPHPAATEGILPWEVVRLRHRAADEGYPGLWGEDRYFADQAWAFIRTQPGAFARGLLHKSAMLVTSREIPSYEDVYLQRRWSWLLRPLAWKVGAFGFPFGVLLPLAAVGMLYGARRLPALLILFVVAEFASLVLAHVVGRTRTTVVPELAILAAIGAGVLGAAVADRRWSVLAGSLAVAGVVVLAATWPGPFALERINTEAELQWSAGYYHQLRSDNPDAALRHYRRALELNPDSAGTHFNIATVLSGAGQLDEAIAHYRQAVRLAPAYPEFHFNLGNALAQRGSSAEAIEQYRAALAVQPRSPESHYNLAFALTDLGDRDGAIAQYREALALDREFFAAAINLGLLLQEREDLAGAATAFREAVRIHPQDPNARARLGDILAAQGLTDQAAAEYRQALRIDPRHAAAQAGLHALQRR